MAVRLRPDGTWEFDLLREAVEFERLKARPSAPVAASRPSPAEPRESTDQDKRSMKALRVLVSVGRKGIPTSEFAPQLGLAHSKGISSVAQQVRRRIAAVANGTPVDKIFWAEGRAGNRRWCVDAAKIKELGLV